MEKKNTNETLLYCGSSSSSMASKQHTLVVRRALTVPDVRPKRTRRGCGPRFVARFCMSTYLHGVYISTCNRDMCIRLAVPVAPGAPLFPRHTRPSVRLSTCPGTLGGMATTPCLACHLCQGHMHTCAASAVGMARPACAKPCRATCAVCPCWRVGPYMDRRSF